MFEHAPALCIVISSWNKNVRFNVIRCLKFIQRLIVVFSISLTLQARRSDMVHIAQREIMDRFSVESTNSGRNLESTTLLSCIKEW